MFLVPTSVNIGKQKHIALDWFIVYPFSHPSKCVPFAPSFTTTWNLCQCLLCIWKPGGGWHTQVPKVILIPQPQDVWAALDMLTFPKSWTPPKTRFPPPLWNHHVGCVFFLEQGLKQLKIVRPLLEPVYLVYLHRNQPFGRGSFPT